MTSESRAWLQDLSFDQDFKRNAAALLRPGSSAILAAISDWQSALEFLSGYSSVVLHTTIIRSSKRNEQEQDSKPGGSNTLADWMYSTKTRREEI